MKLELDSDLHLRPRNQSDLKGKYIHWFNDYLITRHSLHGKFNDLIEYGILRKHFLKTNNI